MVALPGRVTTLSGRGTLGPMGAKHLFWCIEGRHLGVPWRSPSGFCIPSAASGARWSQCVIVLSPTGTVWVFAQTGAPPFGLLVRTGCVGVPSPSDGIAWPLWVRLARCHARSTRSVLAAPPTTTKIRINESLEHIRKNEANQQTHKLLTLSTLFKHSDQLRPSGPVNL
jgi:hypothetical protein